MEVAIRRKLELGKGCLPCDCLCPQGRETCDPSCLKAVIQKHMKIYWAINQANHDWKIE